MVRFASLIRSAITRRTPITLISVVSDGAGDAPEAIAPEDAGPDGSAETRAVPASAPVGGLAAARPSAAIKSLRRMRPPGPDPSMVDKSMPASRARRRFAGDAFTRPRSCAPRSCMAAIDAPDERGADGAAGPADGIGGADATIGAADLADPVRGAEGVGAVRSE